MDQQMPQGHGPKKVAGTWTNKCHMDMDQQLPQGHGPANAARTRTNKCSRSIDQTNAAGAWTKQMQQEHGPNKCRMDIQHSCHPRFAAAAVSLALLLLLVRRGFALRLLSAARVLLDDLVALLLSLVVAGHRGYYLAHFVEQHFAYQWAS